jgi:multiple sugar transport system permease protein
MASAQGTRPRRRWSRDETETKVLNVLKWASIVLFVVITAFPLIYMVGLSFKPISELLREPANFLPDLEDVIGLDTYRQVFVEQGFGRFIVNSLIVTLGATFFTVTASIFAAYAMVRLRFRGKTVVTGTVLVVYLFPAIIIAIPLFVLFSRLTVGDVALRSTLAGLIIVYLAQTIPVALYMLRSQFLSIPVALEEAGMIDGLSRIGVIRRITLPLAAPAIAAVSLYVFMIAWNEFLFALLFLVDQPALWTLPLGLQQLDSTEVPKTVLMAGSVVMSLPIILLFFLAERFLTEGLTAGGVKG